MPRTIPKSTPRSSGRGTVTYVDLKGHSLDAVVTGGTGRTGTNETQTLTVTATGGTYRITFNGQQTPALAYNISNANLQAALEALLSIGTGNIAVSGGPSATAAVTLTYQGSLGKLNVPLATVDGSLLTGPSSGATLVLGADGTGTDSTSLNLFVPSLPKSSQYKSGIARRTTVAATNVWF